MIVGWARVSSEEQGKGWSIENQCRRLEQAGCDEIISDVESAYQPGIEAKFNQLVAMVEAGRVRQVIVCNFDRLSRNELIGFHFYDLLDRKKVRLLSLDQPYIDILTPDGRAMAGHLLVENRAYSARLSDKVRGGHKAHRDRNAAYFPLFGYKVIDEKYELDHEPFLSLLETRETLSRAAIARTIIEAFLEVRSLRRTLIWLNSHYGIFTHTIKGSGNRHARGKFTFQATGLGSWLNHPVLRGHTAYGRGQRQRQSHQKFWDIRYDTHPEHRIISDLEYLQIEEILRYNAEHGGFQFLSDTIHPLSGLIYCAECGGKCRVTHFRLKTDRTIKRYSYQCLNYQSRACTQKTSLREEIIEAELIRQLCDRAAEIAQQVGLPQPTVEPVKVQELRQQLRVLEELGDNPAIAAARESLRQQIGQELQALGKTESAQEVRQERLLEIYGIDNYWKIMPPKEKQSVYRYLVHRIWMRGGAIERIELRC